MRILRCPFLALVALCIMLTALPRSADAQFQCGAPAEIVSALSERFGEASAARGVTAGGRLLRLFVSEAGTWTILIVLPDGRACVVGHGDGWQRNPALPVVPRTNGDAAAGWRHDPFEYRRIPHVKTRMEAR